MDASTPGTYTFRFEVCPEEYIGAAVSLLTLLLLVGAAYWWWRKRRRHTNDGEHIV